MHGGINFLIIVFSQTNWKMQRVSRKLLDLVFLEKRYFRTLKMIELKTRKRLTKKSRPLNIKSVDKK